MDDENKSGIRNFLVGIFFILFLFYGFCFVCHGINVINAVSVYGNIFHSIGLCDSSCQDIQVAEKAYALKDFQTAMVFLVLMIISGLYGRVPDNNAEWIRDTIFIFW